MTNGFRKIVIALVLLRYSGSSFAQINGDTRICLRPGTRFTVILKEKEKLDPRQLVAYGGVGPRGRGTVNPRQEESQFGRTVCSSEANASFTLSGDPYLAFSVNVPGTFTFYGVHPISVQLHLNLPQGTCVPGPTGTQTAVLKATLNVSPQAPETYHDAAEIPVTINYD